MRDTSIVWCTLTQSECRHASEFTIDRKHRVFCNNVGKEISQLSVCPITKYGHVTRTIKEMDDMTAETKPNEEFRKFPVRENHGRKEKLS
jgi:hypothetical protein